MDTTEQSSLKWIKASKSYGAGACVELAPHGDAILLRDSKNPHVLLRFTATEIYEFLDGAKKGEFDCLVGGA